MYIGADYDVHFLPIRTSATSTDGQKSEVSASGSASRSGEFSVASAVRKKKSC